MRDVTEALARMEERKNRAESEYDAILASLLADESFENDYRRLSYLNFEIARREVYKEDAADLIAEREKLLPVVENALIKKGADGVGKPRYHCDRCHDTGYIDGKRCACLEKERVNVNLSNNPTLVSVPDGLKEVDVNFYKEGKNDYLLLLKDVRKNFVKGDVHFLTLIGKAGTGKTYVASTAVKELLFSGKMVSVLNSVTLNKIFLQYHCAYLADKGDVWEQLIEPDVLLIDDLGAESVLNNVTEPYLYELLVERADKKTIVTTNLSLDAIAQRYNQRIMSRLSDKRKSVAIEINGKDLRLV